MIEKSLNIIINRERERGRFIEWTLLNRKGPIFIEGSLLVRWRGVSLGGPYPLGPFPW